MNDEITETAENPPGSGEEKFGRTVAPYLIVLVGVRAGEMFRLSRLATLTGRGDDVDLHLAEDGVSRRHAVFLWDGANVILRDLGSANGTFLNGTRIVEPVALADGDKISLGGTLFLKFALQDALEEQVHRQLYEAAVKDALTGVYNRRYFEDRLRAEMSYAIRRQTPLALMMADIDDFKLINDSRGHQVGDETLREVARRLASAIRAEDVLARYGGEEFVILCRDIGKGQAWALADRLLQMVAHTLPGTSSQPPFPVTVSIGVALGPEEGPDPSKLIGAADAALYDAKRQGRNRAVVFEARDLMRKAE